MMSSHKIFENSGLKHEFTFEEHISCFRELFNSLAQLKAIYDGFVDFCREIKINLEDIMKLMKIRTKYHSFDEYLTKVTNENVQHRAYIKDLLLEEWIAHTSVGNNPKN